MLLTWRYGLKVGSSITATSDWIDLKKGDVFTLIKEFFYNGETWVRLKNKDGVVVEFPSVFFYN